MVEFVHVRGPKGQRKCQHFIETAPERPHIWLLRVVVIVPNFWTCIARGPSLCLVHFVFEDFADIQVTYLDATILADKNVGSLKVAVDDTKLVKRFKSKNHLNEDSPNFALSKELARLLMCFDTFMQVTSIYVLHNNAQCLVLLIQKCFLVTDDVGFSQRGKNTYFIKRICQHFLVQVTEFHHFERIFFLIFVTPHMKYLWISTFA